MMLTDLINLGSGFEDSTFRKTVFFNSAELIRRMPDKKYDKVIKVNLDSVVFGDYDLRLQNLDKFVVHANTNFFERKYKAARRDKGSWVLSPLISDGESLLNVINRAGVH